MSTTTARRRRRQVYAVAYWTNTWGDTYLEQRDQGGGGWSTAYASTVVSTDPDTLYEVTGGKLLVFAPDDEQGFPGFGADGKLFTDDDPVAPIPAGWSVIDLDQEPVRRSTGRRPDGRPDRAGEQARSTTSRR